MVRLRNISLAGAGLVYAAFAMANGADRISAMSPGFERLVPAPFRSSAHVAAATMAMARKDYAQGEADAARAVAASPLNREAVGVLAVSRLLEQKADAADAAFRVSGLLGWRDTPTQLYWYAVGIDSGDTTLAAQRVDAILRATPSYPEATQLLRPLENTPEGRAALIERLTERPNWLSTYPHPGKDSDDEQIGNRAIVLGQLAARRIVLGCDAVSDLAFRLVDRGMRPEALALWSQQCGRTPTTSGLFDPAFQSLSNRRQSPFDWRRATSGDIDVQAVTQPDGSTAIAASNLSSFPLAALSQPLALAPGAYRVRLDVANPPGSRGRVFASVNCANESGHQVVPNGDILGAGQIVTVGACPQQVLNLWLRPAPDAVILRRISLEPAARP